MNERNGRMPTMKKEGRKEGRKEGLQKTEERIENSNGQCQEGIS
jgi:hypothetical protein